MMSGTERSSLEAGKKGEGRGSPGGARSPPPCCAQRCQVPVPSQSSPPPSLHILIHPGGSLILSSFPPQLLIQQLRSHALPGLDVPKSPSLNMITSIN